MRQKLFTEIFILFSDKKILWRYSYHDEITQESNSVIDISRRSHGIRLSIRNAERALAPPRQAHKQNGAEIPPPRTRDETNAPRTQRQPQTQRLRTHVQTIINIPLLIKRQGFFVVEIISIC